MPHIGANTASKHRAARRNQKTKGIPGTSRYSVGLPSAVAVQVENYADTSDISVSKAIVALVRLGLESQEARKREFFKKLRINLANDDPKLDDQMVDEFRTLILGH
jgi:hypothetical protein